MAAYEQVAEKNVEELLAEMSECREDERSAQNQMVQVIATAGTILTLIFGATYIIDDMPKGLLFHLSNFIFCTAIGYITTLGISNVLRYHYLRNIEDKLFLLISNCSDTEHRLIHWMSFSAPVITRNPQHIKGQYTWMHYLCYTVATICAILFCVVITVIQYLSLDKYSVYDKVGMGLSVIFFSFSMMVFFYSAYKAEAIYRFARRVSSEKRKERLYELQQQGQNDESQKEKDRETSKKSQGYSTGFLKAVGYFIYPKKKDFQKPFLLALGFITGIFLNQDVRPLGVAIRQFTIVFITIDFFLYQARYQWNDIRGLREDRNAGKSDRLPKIAGDKNDRSSVKLSMIVMMVKIISLFIVIFCFGGEMTVPLLTCSIVIILVAILYEVARTKKKNKCIFFMVSLGYPLRFLAGLWSAHPKIPNFMVPLFELPSKITFFLQQFWNNGGKGIDAAIQLPVVALLLLAYGFWGVTSVILAWTHEAINKKRHQKSYYEYLSKKVKRGSLIMPKKSQWILPGNYLLSHRENGSLKLPRNWTYVCSISCLSFIVCIVALYSDTHIWGLFLAIEFATLALSVSIIVKRLLFQDRDRLCVMVFFIIMALKCALFIHCSGWYLFYIYIVLTQSLFTLAYFFLRYHFDPDFNFVDTVKKAMRVFLS